MLDVLDAYLDGRGYPSNRIDGSMDYKVRMHQIEEFNNDPNSFVFLLSTRAGGLGINLTSSDTVIIYDSDWNPHQDMQVCLRWTCCMLVIGATKLPEAVSIGHTPVLHVCAHNPGYPSYIGNCSTAP